MAVSPWVTLAVSNPQSAPIGRGPWRVLFVREIFPCRVALYSRDPKIPY